MVDDVEYEADDEREDVPWMKGMVKEGEAPNEGQRNEVSRSSWMTKTRRKTAISISTEETSRATRLSRYAHHVLSNKTTIDTKKS